jgi:DNA polymerase III epsilon subunit-like protein
VISDNCPEFSRGSLNKLADQLGVTRDNGTQEHTAGSDSKLTAKCFFALKNREEVVDECENIIFNFHF